MPTTLNARLSFHSRRSTSESTDMRHNNAEPDITSMKLSSPNPTRETLPATAPKLIASNPSIAFQTMVKYSSLRPRCAAAARTGMEFSLTHPVYKGDRFSSHPPNFARRDELHRQGRGRGVARRFTAALPKPALLIPFLSQVCRRPLGYLPSIEMASPTPLPVRSFLFHYFFPCASSNLVFSKVN